MAEADQTFTTRAMASLVEELNPGRLAELRQRFPGSASLFDTAYVMGADTAAAAVTAAGPAQATLGLKALIEDTLASLPRAIERVQVQLTQRIHKARRLRLAGSLIAAVSSAGTVAALTASQPMLAPVPSIVALAASLAMLLGEHYEKAVMGGSRSLSELLGVVMAAEPQVQDIRLQLMIDDLSQTKPLYEMARKLNELSANVKQASLFGGVSLA